MPFHVEFEPLGRAGEALAGENLLDCARRLGVVIASACGGRGQCRACRVQVLQGQVSELNEIERKVFAPDALEAGWRRACQTLPTSDCRVAVPPPTLLTRQRTQVEGQTADVPAEPAIRVYGLRLAEPSLTDYRADAERLLDALSSQHGVACTHIDLELLRELSPRLREWDWQVQATVRDDEVIALHSWDGRPLGLAMDVGTTKLAAYLVDLRDGRALAAKGAANPQINFGDDVISRINHAIRIPGGGMELQRILMEEVEHMATRLCRKIGARREDIVEAVLAGNTAMHHLMARLPVEQLARAPYLPAASAPLELKARELGLHFAPGAYVHLLPNIAGFVGGDHTAMLLAVSARQVPGTQLFLDIGTNTEVSLVSDGQIYSVSCASGPAFEGGHIKDGMRAAAGAIEKIWILDGMVHYQTIDDLEPVGICGSGILDAIAQLFQAGVLDGNGRMGATAHPRVRPADNGLEFVLVAEDEKAQPPAIVITQHDVREVQLAKAAVRSGIEMLLRAAGRREEDLDQVVIAGAFGTYIDLASAVAIGMLPRLPLERFHQIGNAAGMGARQALVSISRRAEARAIAAQVHYVELAADPSFTETFTECLSLKR